MSDSSSTVPADQAAAEQRAVTLNSDADRYEVRLGDELAGFAQFRDDEGRRVFLHTVVDDRFAGRGLAGTLVARALDDVRDDGLRAVAVCSYVARFVQKHPEYQDLVDPAPEG